MRKIFRLLYLFTMAALVLSMSGCGGSSSSLSSSSGNKGKLMVISSPVLKKGESYKFYRGDKVSATSSTTANYNVSYYVAPLASYESAESVAVNLEFTQSIADDDQPFMITTADDDSNVVFFYNPNGNGNVDTSTPYGSVIRSGGSTQQLSYSGLTLAGASFKASVLDNLDLSNQIRITLNADDNTATMNGTAIPSYDYVWHADPDHRDEYYTLGSSTTELTEDYVNNAITENIYIARDIRYMPNTLSFTGTAKNDEETEYAAYYSDSVAAEVAAELGSGFSGPYIFATLPMSTGGMPGGDGGGMTPPDGNFPSGDMTPPDGGFGSGDRTPPDGGTPPNMRSAVSNSDIAAFSTMTHSASEAYNNPVLHIHEAGVYRLSGTWHGQIWIDVDDQSDVFVILDGVTVSCDVAPAIVFHDLYECGPTDEDTVASTWRTLGSNLANEAGAVVVIADGSVNNFKGTNIYRMLKAQKKKDSVTTIDGTDVSQQKKRYKMDGAFYSFVSMVIGAESENATGVLNITSDYEGLDTEMHLTVDSGTVNVTADEDGINVNEDYISVFTMDGGKLTIVAKNGDGIDSNGYVVINNGTLDITAVQDSDQIPAPADGPIDVIEGGEVYMSDSVTYTHRAYSGSSSTQPQTDTDSGTDTGTDTGTNTGTQTTTSTGSTVIRDADSNVVMSIRYTGAFSDTDTSSRGIDSSGSVFTLSHTVNDFSGVAVR